MTATEFFELFTIIIASLGLCAAMVYWLHYSFHPEEADWLQSFVKTAAILPIGLVLMVDYLSRGDPLWIIAFGLFLGGCGDFFLSRKGDRAFLIGMAAFALGHLAYVIGLTLRGMRLALIDPAHFGQGLLPAWQVWGVLAVIGLILTNELWLIPRTGSLKWPVRGYGVIIGLMVATAILLPANDGARLIQFGAALFVASDLLLALRLFVAQRMRDQKILGALLWPAYVVGQGLIVFGSVLFFTFPKG